MRFGILSDIHEDIGNLEKALRLLEKEGCDQLVCLGDIIGFCEPNLPHVKKRDAAACLKLIRENCKYVVAGNHDLNAAERLPSVSGTFQYPPQWYTMNPAEKEVAAAGRVWLYDDELPAHLDDNSKAYVTSLPETSIIAENGFNILLTHFLAPDICGACTWFPMQKRDTGPHFDTMVSNACILSLFGHVHPTGILRAERTSSIFSYMREPFDFLHLGEYKLGKRMAAFAMPAVVAAERKSGVGILDTSRRTIAAIQL